MCPLFVRTATYCIHAASCLKGYLSFLREAAELAAGLPAIAPLDVDITADDILLPAGTISAVIDSQIIVQVTTAVHALAPVHPIHAQATPQADLAAHRNFSCPRERTAVGRKCWEEAKVLM